MFGRDGYDDLKKRDGYDPEKRDGYDMKKRDGYDLKKILQPEEEMVTTT